MSETEDKKREKRHQEDLERLRSFRPIDDTFMRGLFKDNLPLAELVLRIITGKKDLIDQMNQSLSFFFCNLIHFFLRFNLREFYHNRL